MGVRAGCVAGKHPGHLGCMFRKPPPIPKTFTLQMIIPADRAPGARGGAALELALDEAGALLVPGELHHVPN